MNDSYRTIAFKSKGEFKDKGSKFYSFAFPVSSEEEVKKYQSEIRKEYHDARHHVYAFIIGADSLFYRASDDGEPANSSGMPVLGQIRSNELTNVLIIVIRYFGGIKLGIPGLINAYRSAAVDAIANNKIIEKIIHKRIIVKFAYSHLNLIMRIASESQLEQSGQSFDVSCQVEYLVKQSEMEKVIAKFSIITDLEISIEDE